MVKESFMGSTLPTHPEPQPLDYKHRTQNYKSQNVYRSRHVTNVHSNWITPHAHAHNPSLKIEIGLGLICLKVEK